MRFIGDFHIHSHYSRATSRQLVPEMLDLWGRRKGIAVIGTGDFTHPLWSAELEEKLELDENGLLSLKDEYRVEDGAPRGMRQGPETTVSPDRGDKFNLQVRGQGEEGT